KLRIILRTMPNIFKPTVASQFLYGMPYNQALANLLKSSLIVSVSSVHRFLSLTILPFLKLVIPYFYLLTSVWVFMILLPFQFCQLFGWGTIPASMITSYILFGLLHISYQIENPFGYDINDLDL